MTRFTLVRSALAVTGACALVTATYASPAHAESYNSTCHAPYKSAAYCFKPSGTKWTAAARAHYHDSGNRVRAYDDARDGRSAVVQIWPTGQPSKKRTYWNHSGSGTSVSWKLTARENSRWTMRSCLGEWAKKSSNRRVTSCSKYPVKVYI